jgi:AraC family ethanolamine operon transcriptional activator
MRWAETHEDEFDFAILDRNLVTGACASLAPLLRLAGRLFQIAARSPGELHTPAAEHAARVELLDTVFRTLLPTGPRHEPSRHHTDRLQILRRALDLVESLHASPVYTEDICAATRVSERTVRNIFNDYLGMSPHRYLMVRRLHAMRAAIRRSAPGETVTNVCARYGVWDFGRFARQYRETFGVLPSQTLRQASMIQRQK